jgi:hypothetical protein
MSWLTERLPFEPGERESAPILAYPNWTGVLHSGVMDQARCSTGNLKIDYRESMKGVSHSPHKGPTNAMPLETDN